ncbi:MAG: GIY-YIG nuclease family protein [Opitutales bacterium]
MEVCFLEDSAFPRTPNMRFSQPKEFALQVFGMSKCSVASSLFFQAKELIGGSIRNLCVVYFLRLENGRIYIGATTDLHDRLRRHSRGRACETTRRYQPRSILRIETFESFSAARKRELQLKRWSNAKKDALIAGDTELLRALSQSREGK